SSSPPRRAVRAKCGTSARIRCDPAWRSCTTRAIFIRRGATARRGSSVSKAATWKANRAAPSSRYSGGLRKSQRLPQRRLQLTAGGDAFEAGADHAVAVDDEDPRLGPQVPLLYRWRQALHAAGLPDLLVHEGNAIAIGGNQRAHDVEHRSADAAGAVFRRREHDQLSTALTNGIGDPRLVQPRVRRLARIDEPQIAHVRRNLIAAARRRGTRQRRARAGQSGDPQPRRLNDAGRVLDCDLQAPRAGPR